MLYIMNPNLDTDCRDCYFFNRVLFRCIKYREPIPCNIELKPLKCDSCKKEIKNESKDYSRYNQ